MSDLIDRQQALDAIRILQTYKLFEGDDMILVDKAEAQTELMMLPSAEPERKKGKWLLIDAGYYDYVKCSQCGETLDWEKNFCPNCGADMKEGEEE